MKKFIPEIEDVMRVAKEIDATISHEQIEEVIERYSEAQENDPSATWDLVVEDLIREIIGLSDDMYYIILNKSEGGSFLAVDNFDEPIVETSKTLAEKKATDMAKENGISGYLIVKEV
jgi:hypothetical protein